MEVFLAQKGAEKFDAKLTGLEVLLVMKRIYPLGHLVTIS